MGDSCQGSYLIIGIHFTTYGAPALILSSALAGRLMAPGASLIVATPPSTSQMVAIYIITFLIGFGGLHHSIAGAVEMFAALMIGDEFTVSQKRSIHRPGPG